MSEVPLSDVIAPNFHEVHRSIKRKEFEEYWFAGGRGSTKTSFTSIEVVLGIMKDPLANALCMRKVGETLRRSVYANILWAIDVLGVGEFFDCKKSPLEVVYKPTGQVILFSGLDDPEKLKGIKVTSGYFKFLWFEELTNFNGYDEVRNVMQSVLRGGEDDWDDGDVTNDCVVIMSYNPPKSVNDWVNEEVENEHHSRYVHKSTYLGVPRRWLGKKFIADAERIKRINPEKYRHEYLGEAIGLSDRIIFDGKWEVLDFEEPDRSNIFQGRFFYGVDWGFSTDPTACVRCWIRDNCLYIDYEAGGVGVEIDDTPDLIRTIPEANRWPIVADNARPETISFVSRSGLSVTACDKWPGSVEDGIEYMLNFDRIYIHPRCEAVINEMKRYSYKVDKKTDEVLPDIVDKHNHYIDALRYALNSYIRGGVSILDVI